MSRRRRTVTLAVPATADVILTLPRPGKGLTFGDHGAQLSGDGDVWNAWAQTGEVDIWGEPTPTRAMFPAGDIPRVIQWLQTHAKVRGRGDA